MSAYHSKRWGISGRSQPDFAASALGKRGWFGKQEKRIASIRARKAAGIIQDRRKGGRGVYLLRSRMGQNLLYPRTNAPCLQMTVRPGINIVEYRIEGEMNYGLKGTKNKGGACPANG